MGHGNETGIIPRFCEELFSRADVARDLNKVPVFIQIIWIYTDRQKKRYNIILSGYSCAVLDLGLISIASLGPRASTKVESHVNFTESQKVSQPIFFAISNTREVS